jgi:hypothetical protein
MISLKGDEMSDHEVKTLSLYGKNYINWGQMAFFDNAFHLPRQMSFLPNYMKP